MCCGWHLKLKLALRLLLVLIIGRELKVMTRDVSNGTALLPVGVL
jgi:hypothetical protein